MVISLHIWARRHIGQVWSTRLASDCTYLVIQWNLIIRNTLGPKNFLFIKYMVISLHIWARRHSGQVWSTRLASDCSCLVIQWPLLWWAPWAQRNFLLYQVQVYNYIMAKNNKHVKMGPTISPISGSSFRDVRVQILIWIQTFFAHHKTPEMPTSTFLPYFVRFLKENTAVRFFPPKYVFKIIDFFFFFFFFLLESESSTLHTLFMLWKLGQSFWMIM